MIIHYWAHAQVWCCPSFHYKSGRTCLRTTFGWLGAMTALTICPSISSEDPRAHKKYNWHSKNIIGTPPKKPPKNPKRPNIPPENEDFFGHGGLIPLTEPKKIPGAHEIGEPFPALELRTKHFTDTRLFLKLYIHNICFAFTTSTMCNAFVLLAPLQNEIAPKSC